MTIVEAVSRVANRFCDARYAGLTAQGQQEALDAINAGMMDLYRLLPPHYKNKPLSLPVEGAANVTMQVQKGATLLAANAFTASQIGRTVIAGGDDAQHRVADLGALRDVWLGETGETQGTVYHDYVYGGDFPFDRLLADPVLVTGNVERPLMMINPDTLDLCHLRGIGQPKYYWLEDAGISSGNDVVVAIRLLPMPVVACRLRVRAAYWPRRVLWADVAANAPLPIPDAVAEAFIDLAGVHTIGLSGWGLVGASALITKGQAAEAHVRSLPSFPGLRRNRVGTRRGY